MKRSEALMFLAHLGDATLSTSSDTTETINDIQKECGVYGMDHSKFVYRIATLQRAGR